MLAQDLHVHTTWSYADGAIVREQTIELLAQVRHARVLGISDHFEHLVDMDVDAYAAAVRRAGLWVGTEVNGADWIAAALDAPVDYYVVHCYDTDADYAGLERLLATERPVIVAHPHALGTALARVPTACRIEINNRYIWRGDWRAYYSPHVDRFRFVLSSDAHQPNWLNQTLARYVADELGIEETLVFPS
jgi:histidinol phosphatase-like PHP family hydrolase